MQAPGVPCRAGLALRLSERLVHEHRREGTDDLGGDKRRNMGRTDARKLGQPLPRARPRLLRDLEQRKIEHRVGKACTQHGAAQLCDRVQPLGGGIYAASTPVRGDWGSPVSSWWRSRCHQPTSSQRPCLNPTLRYTPRG